jgi:catechol 2,3-dioxygenase-like lactoylglutathione lyase family enzyme
MLVSLDMRITGVDHVQVAVPRGAEAEARAFYGGALGLEEVAKPEPLASRGGVWFQCGAQQLHVGVEDDFRPAKKAHPALVVEGLDALAQSLAGAGFAYRPAEPLEGRRRGFVDDPFGNRIELIELT